jgi:hypothetical protein
MSQEQMGKMMQGQMQMQRQMASRGMAGGPGSGGPGAGGQSGAPGAGAGSNVDTTPADFHSPEGAVQAFLSALKAKDQDRLSEATALRAGSQVEGGSRNRDMFKKIIDLALSDSELDDLSKRLEGFEIASRNPMTSTGRIGVVLQKANEDGGYTRRLVTVRHEKKGWGVMDIGPPTVFKSGRVPRKSSGRGY